MDIQRLRNLTTGKLHTKMEHIYEDLETITGERGLMTHMLPGVCAAVRPWLREQIPDARFWDSSYDPTHTGDFPLPEPTAADRAAMLAVYNGQPNPLEGKQVIGIVLAVPEGEE